MEKTIVGEDRFSALEVFEQIKKQSDPFGLLLQRWRSFALYLSLDQTHIAAFTSKLNVQGLELNLIILEIISVWQTKFMEKATVKVLYDALVKCENLANAEDLKAYWEEIKNKSRKQAENRLKVDGVTIDFLRNKTPLEVSVIKPTEKRAFKEDKYGLNGDDNGHVLIINIMDFQTNDRRNGSEKDIVYVKDLFLQLGYKKDKITVHNPGVVNQSDLNNYIADFKGKFLDTSGENSSCIVYIGSHGYRDHILTSDGQLLNIYTKIIYEFDSQKCPAMLGKPKVFLFQACQQFSDRLLPDDVSRPPINDTLVCLSSFPGYISLRDPYLGSWFTYCATKVIMENAHCHHFQELMEMTQDAMETIEAKFPKKSLYEGQKCSTKNMGFKKLYFNLKP